MDTTWLSSWLTELNLSEYIGTFENAGYTTLELCATIADREELKNIGITKLGHLSRLVRAVEKLRGEPSGEVLFPVGSTLSNSGRSDSQLDRLLTFQQSKCSSLGGEGMALCSELTGSQKTHTYGVCVCVCVCVCVQVMKPAV